MRAKLTLVCFLLEVLLAIWAGMEWLATGDPGEFLILVVCLLCAVIISWVGGQVPL